MVAAGALALGFFLLVYKLPEKHVLMLLIALIPIQLITSDKGTLNVAITYVIAFAFLLQGRLKSAPLFWAIFLVFFAYVISFSMAHPDAQIFNLLYMIGFCSNFLIFYLVYNFIERTNDWKSIVRALLWGNLLVIIACFIEIALGDRQVVLFGFEDWKLGSIRARHDRIVGPFGSTHTTADYIVSQCMIIGYLLISQRGAPKRWLLLLLLGNFVSLTATGDRGGFIGLILGALLFLYLFRREIGGFRVVQYSIAGFILFTVASFLVVEYTEFGRMYERLAETDLEGENKPRVGDFRRAINLYMQSPIIGLGPKLNVSSKQKQVGNIAYRGSHPHNLFLTVLVTTGVVGLMAWLTFFGVVVFTLIRGARCRLDTDPAISNMPKLGLLILLLFMVGEFRIEFLRDDFWDYQQYRFALLGVFLACSNYLIRCREQVFMRNLQQRHNSIHRPA
jgi:hypothetical protein